MYSGVLLSGGMDSAIALYWARVRRGGLTAWSIDYGQKHKRELVAAKAIAKAAGVPHRQIKLGVPWPPIGSNGVVYGRNLALLNTVGAQLAVRGGGDTVELIIGATREDFDGFPDCRPEFMAAASRALTLGFGIETFVVAPFVTQPKAHMLTEARSMPGAWEAIGLSWTCYEGKDVPCGACSACTKRAAAFAEAGQEDPWHA